MKPPVIILHAPGTNRDREAALACTAAGGDPHVVLVDDVVKGRTNLSDYAMLLLPGGIEQYLAERSEAATPAASGASGASGKQAQRSESDAARSRRTGKELARIESQLGKLDERIAALHETMADAAWRVELFDMFNLAVLFALPALAVLAFVDHRQGDAPPPERPWYATR